MGYVVLLGALLVVFLYLLWLRVRHPFLFKGFAIFSMLVFGVALLGSLHDIKESLTYSLATILFTLATEEFLELKKKISQQLVNDTPKTDYPDKFPKGKVFKLINPAGLVLVLLVALGFYINLKLLPPDPPYMP